MSSLVRLDRHSARLFVLLAVLAVAVGTGGEQDRSDRAGVDRGSPADAAFAAIRAEVGFGPEIIQSPLHATDRWAAGTLAIPAAVGEEHEEPRVFLYVARRAASGWEATIEGDGGFQTVAGEAAEALAGTSTANLLRFVGPPDIGDGSAELSLPWAVGETWRMTGGPHNFNGSSSRTWSSLDLAGPTPGASAKVHAARSGIVVRPCDNLVQIRHADGWATSYYHLARIAVRPGESVTRGQFIGHTSTRAGCGGRATGPHVHFSLLKNGEFVDIAGHTIGGWTVSEGASTYTGCMVRDGDEACAPQARIHNDGSVGTALAPAPADDFDTRGPRLE